MAQLPEGLDDGAGARSCVGRVDELERVQQAVADLAAGRGGVLLVEGVAGIGKTFLLDQVLDAAEQRSIATAVGGSGGLDNERPFSGIFGALRCTERADDPRRVAVWRMVADARMGTLWDREGAIARFAVSDALVDLVEQEVSRFPLLLMVDDLHWTDSASLHALCCTRAAVLPIATPDRRRLSTRPVERRSRPVAGRPRSDRDDAATQPARPGRQRRAHAPGARGFEPVAPRIDGSARRKPVPVGCRGSRSARRGRNAQRGDHPLGGAESSRRDVALDHRVSPHRRGARRAFRGC